MTQQLIALAALAENQGSVPSTHMAAHTFNPSTEEAQVGNKKRKEKKKKKHRITKDKNAHAAEPWMQKVGDGEHVLPG